MKKKRIASHASFRLYLQDELIQRCRKNPGYSLRAFAKALEINHSSLSRLLNAERPISEKIQQRLGLKLGLNLDELSRFQNNEKSADRAKKESRDFQQLSRDSFAVISDWYHYAILELTNLQSFQSDARWIAKTLAITTSEANAAIERLLRLGFLEKNAKGRLINRSGNNTNITQDMRDAAKRNMQKQVLEMALRALEEVPLEKRNQTSMTMAINSRRLAEATEMIASFRRELSSFLEQDDERDHVYQLGISLYPLTKLESTGVQH